MTRPNMNPHHALVLTVLQHVSTERLQKVVSVLAEGRMTVTLTRQTGAEIRALVTNGEGRKYGVTLTEAGVFCSCPDALYRGVTCKHATLLALTVLPMPQAREEHPPEEPQTEEQKPYNLKLARVRPGYCG